jgi:glycerophosphoryl diester phosphodiesterase
MGADAPPVFTDAGWTWMLNKLNTEFVPALGNETIIDAIDGKLDKNQGTVNAGKYLKVGADGNVETADLDVTTDKTLSIAEKAADAKTVGNELTGLKADLSDLNRYASRTIDKTLESGFYTAEGNFRPDSANVTFTTKDFFVVNKEIPIRFIGQLSTVANSWCAISYFDADKKFLSRYVFHTEGLRNYANAYLTPPDGAYYGKFSYRVNAEWTFDYYYIFDATSYAPTSGLSVENFMLGRLVQGEVIKTGAETLSRVSTINKVKFDKDKSVSVNSGYAFAVHLFDKNGMFAVDSGWITTEYWIPANTEFRLMIRVNPANDSVIANIDNCVSALKIYDKYNNDSIIIRGGFSEGKITNHATRALTPSIKKYSNMVKVSAVDDYQVAIVELRNDTLFYDYYWRDNWFMPAKAEFRLLIQRKDGTAVDLNAHCFSITEFEKEPSNSNFKCVNHRGFVYAPENTLLAYQLSIEAGFRLVETDVMFTYDNVPVLLHDTTINRTARNPDYTTISNTIRIDEITYEQALTYTFNQGKNWYKQYVPIPTFEEFISFCKFNSLQPYIELKTDSNLTDTRAETLVNIVRKYGMLRNTTWISFNETLLQKIRALDGKSRVGFLFMGDDMSYPLSVLQQLGGNSYLEIDLDTITEAQINTCITNGIELEVWSLGEILDFTTINPYVTRLTNNYYHN